jgi:hypothetical protein
MTNLEDTGAQTVTLLSRADIPSEFLDSYSKIRIAVCCVRVNPNTRISRLRFMRQSTSKPTVEQSSTDLTPIPDLSSAVSFLQRLFASSSVPAMDKFLGYLEQLDSIDQMKASAAASLSNNFVSQALDIMSSDFGNTIEFDKWTTIAISPGHAIYLYKFCVNEALRNIHHSIRSRSGIDNTNAVKLLKCMRTAHPGLADAIIVHQVIY